MIGAGAVGMAFVDTLLTETDADIIMVDRHHMPGGHWNDAYPFVRLHQPSAFYGVASRELGTRRIDKTGSNKGYFELASGAEVSSYFEQVMREHFLSSGRVRYFPMCDYVGEGRFQSLLSGAEHEVSVRHKTVDGTFFKTSVPSTHKRKYAVADGVACITPNELPIRAADFCRFTIVGAGKTGMDTGVWLMDNGADPENVRWICPRDSWLINRETTQPSVEFFDQAIGAFATQMEAMAAATSVDDLFDRLEATGSMVRIDESVKPEMFHYATISLGEVDQLRRINDVIREGRVERIEPDRLIMQNGAEIPADPDTLYIDCTATAVAFSGASQPIFDGATITLQSLRSPNLTFSAALAAHVEATYDTEEEKNRLCTPVILADNPTQWMASTLGNMTNQITWSQDKPLREWITSCRLDGFGAVVRDGVKADPSRSAILTRIRDSGLPAAFKLQKLIEEAAD